MDTKITDEQKEIIFPVINKFWKFIQATYDGGNMDDDYWDSLLGSENLLRNDIPEGPMRDFWDKLIVAYNDLLEARSEEAVKAGKIQRTN